ncbi:MAG: hypothetical protein H6740_13455 [Alphaproteobacteria bacterium]|nr:hypothetical protein [Alphaproteobacteria bacterium]
MKGNWSRFQLAFLTSLSDKKTRWTDVARETLDKLELAATALRDANVNRIRATKILSDITALRRRVTQAAKDYDDATGDSGRKAAISALQACDGEAQTLLEEAHAAARLGLDSLKGSQGGRDLIDQMISEIDWSANHSEDEAFGVLALKARFNIETVTGKLGHKALPRLYALMKGLPESHVRTNDRLKNINRETPLRRRGGVYSSRDDKVTITMKRSTGPLSGSFTPDADDDVMDIYKPKEGSTPLFNHVTLHEIGHAYDHSVGFMGTHGRGAAYGGWESASYRDIAEALGGRDGFFTETAFANIPRSFLQDYLSWSVEKGDGADAYAKGQWSGFVDRASAAPDATAVRQQPSVAEVIRLYNQYVDDNDTEHTWPADDVRESRASGYHSTIVVKLKSDGLSGDALRAKAKACMDAIRGILVDKKAPGTAINDALRGIALYAEHTPPWDTMKAHKAAKLCRRFKTTEAGFWKDGASAATEDTFKVGRHVYTVDSQGGLYRYLAAARAFAVTKYQWHAPAEWFAELYALYFAGKIKETHPAYDLFLSGLGEPFEV